MNLNLNDVNSIVTWWQVHPERHSSYLEWKLSVSGEFAPAIREAQRRIASTPELRRLLTNAANSRQEHQAREAARDCDVSSRELRYRELAQAA